MVHASAQVSGLSFGNTGDQVGGSSERQRGRKALDDRGPVATKARLGAGSDGGWRPDAEF